jgi:hypothetical protein
MNDPWKLYLKPAPGERLEAAITLPEDPRAVIFGQVKTQKGAPASSLPVLLFGENDATPLMQAITDEGGCFCFGPLAGDRLYYINVYPGTAKVRTVEVDVST